MCALRPGAQGCNTPQEHPQHPAARAPQENLGPSLLCAQHLQRKAGYSGALENVLLLLRRSWENLVQHMQVINRIPEEKMEIKAKNKDKTLLQVTPLTSGSRRCE